jgi:hypothetical protein
VAPKPSVSTASPSPVVEIQPYIPDQFDNANSSPNSETTQRSVKEREVASPKPLEAIRSVDLKRLSYPRYRDLDGNHITIESGEAWPAFVKYGDVTGDGREDAIVVLAEQTRGTAIPYHVYFFSIVEDKPTLLADIETCDRADGGLRRAYAQGDNLILGNNILDESSHP